MTLRCINPSLNRIVDLNSAVILQINPYNLAELFYEGTRHLREVLYFSRYDSISPSLSQRACHLTVGSLLLIPLINIVVYQILLLRKEKVSIEMENSLVRWCNEEEYFMAHEDRMYVAEKIRICSLDRDTELVLDTYYTTSLPVAIGQLNSHLRTLKIICRELTEFPREIGNLTLLQNLDLSHNRLTQLPPEIANLTNLRVLYATDNLLTQIPLYLANLPSLCMLRLSNNRFSQQAIMTFQQEVQRVRRESGRARVLHWVANVYEPQPVQGRRPVQHSPENSWTDSLATFQNFDQLDRLNTLLSRLEQSADFVNPNSRPLLIERVRVVLNDNSFREKLSALLDQPPGCSDEATHTFSLIELHYRLHTTVEKREKIALIIGTHRESLVQAALLRICTNRSAGDQMEVLLYGKLKLKERLGLPFFAQGMAYSGMGAQIVREADLETIGEQVLRETSEEESQVEILLSYDAWREECDKALKEEIDRINERYSVAPDGLKDQQTIDFYESAKVEIRAAQARYTVQTLREALSA